MPVEKIKRLFRVMSLLLAVVLAGVFALLLHTERQRQEQVWENTLQDVAAMEHQQLAANRRHLLNQASQAAGFLSRDAELVALIRKAYYVQRQDPSQTSAELTRLRADALQKLQPYWEGLQAHKANQLHIYFAPDATSFVRVHRPERFGDRLTKLRPLVMQALTSGNQATGLEVGRHGISYRAVIPITTANQPLTPVVGAIEVGFALLPELDQSQMTDISAGSAVLIAPWLLDEVLWDKARDDITLPSARGKSQWLLEDFTHAIAEEWHAEGLLPTPLMASDHEILTWNGRSYSIQLSPLKDFQSEKISATTPIGAIVSWRDITDELATYSQEWRSTWVTWLIALIITQLFMLMLWRFLSAHIKVLVDEHHMHLQNERGSSENARERLDLALSSGESGFWEWDIINNQAKFSPQWREICGIPPEYKEIPDADEWLNRVHPNDKTICFDDMVRHIKGETPFYENEYRLRTQDGFYKWIYTRGKVVERLPDGRAARMLGAYTDISGRKNTELALLRQQAALRALNDIASLPAVEFEEQLRRSLILGARHLGLQNGIISYVTNTRYNILVQVSPDGYLKDGESIELGLTPCSITLADGDVVAIQRMSDAPYTHHPSRDHIDVSSYIGVPLWVEGDVYGTVSFSSVATRVQLFDSQDKDFMRLLARWMGSVISHWNQDGRQRALYDRFNKLSDRLPGFLYQYQLNPDGTSFFPHVSAGIKNIYGVEQGRALVNAAAIFDVVHPDDVERVARSVDESAENLTMWRISYRVNHPRRGLIWVQGDAQPERLPNGAVLWHGFISDVTATKLAEQRLQETNALREAIFNAASAAIIATNEIGLIRSFNRGAEKMLGYTAEEMVDKNTPAIFHVYEEVVQHAKILSQELGYEVHAGFEAFVARARLGQNDENEWHYVHRNGTRIPVLLSVTSLRDDQGKINGFVGIARDISELKRADRMKSEFISTVSHELRTPLTAISGSLGLIVGGALGEMPESMNKMINIAHKNSLRLNHLVNDLLDMEKLVAGKMHFDMQTHPLEAIVQQALEVNASYAAQYNVTFELQSNVPDVTAVVDAARLLQVLTNFLSNAAKFSAPDSKVIIAINEVNDLVRISVKDSGLGIPGEFRSRIFQKFSQADSSDRRQKGGTGLGLAICKELIERMGGTIGFTSEVGQGSTFYFDFPRVDIHQPLQTSSAYSSARRILVVEDNYEVSELIAAMLRNAGYMVDVAHTGAIALMYLAQRSYSLVTLDLLLPDINGVQIIRKIRQQVTSADLPIVVISAEIDEGRLQMSGEVSAQGIHWLEKPMYENQLLQLVEQSVANRKNTPARILHVEDDIDLQKLVAFVGHEHAEFEGAKTLGEAREKIAQKEFHLIILDLGLPDGNGWELLEEIRIAQPSAKVIVLSSDELSEDKKMHIEMSLVKSRDANFELLKVIEQLHKA